MKTLREIEDRLSLFGVVVVSATIIACFAAIMVAVTWCLIKGVILGEI